MTDREFQVGKVRVVMTDDEIAHAYKLVAKGVPIQEAMEVALFRRDCHCMEVGLSQHLCGGLGFEDD